MTQYVNGATHKGANSYTRFGQLQGITYRMYRSRNIKNFMEVLPSSQHLNKREGSVNELVEAYDNGDQSIINRRAPSCSKTNTRSD